MTVPITISTQEKVMTSIQATPHDHPDRSFPRLHPRPAKGWVNDPNGIMFADGRWHLFFQYNPESARHEHICWGHVSSSDLLTWQEHPVALRPQPGPDSFGCWSGIGVVDDGVPTVVYSGAPDRSGFSPALVVRGSADALDWSGERVVAAGLPADERVTMVRDPFVFELGGRRWAIQGAGRTDVGGALLLYNADDIEAWQEHGYLLTAADDIAAQLPDCDGWECPQLVRSGDDWVVLVSLWFPNAPHRGVGYIVGSLDIDADTGLPVFTGRSAGILDEGSSFYAPQAVQTAGEDGQPDRVLLWGWAQEIAPEGVRARTQEDNDEHGWSGLLTHPRELVVRDDVVELIPARELTGLRAEPADPDKLPDQAEVVLTGQGTAALRIVNEQDAREQIIWSGELTEGDEVRILIDASLVEVHRSGRPSLTLRAYPNGHERYAVSHEPGLSAAAWNLRLPSPQTSR